MVSSTEWAPSEGIRLDDATLEAIRRTSSLAIIAGPGAGKTELLAQRASFLLQTGACPQPHRILAISFKRDAAKNLRERVGARLGRDAASRLESYTFDAFAKSLVDRFSSALPAWCRPTRDYRIAFPTWRDWNKFAEDLELPQAFEHASINGQQIEKWHAHTTSETDALPLNEPKPKQIFEWAALQWWRANIDASPSTLTFAMISTLAITILRHNPAILKALRRTYSHVFLDEFQDTTRSQYALFLEAFKGSSAVITAVGDTKQRIMTWAGAVPEAFDWLNRDFGAESVALRSNFRSNTRIVQIVNAFAKKVEPKAIEIECARLDAPLPEIVDGIWSFENSQVEATTLAEFVAQDTATREGASPHDFLLLVRQRADDMESCLRPAFADKGLTLRNEARIVGSTSIQDLMTEPLADLIVGVLQLACEDREGTPFQRVRNLIGHTFGLDDDRPESHFRLDEAVRRAVLEAQRSVRGTQPNEADMRALVDAVLSAFDRRRLRQLAPEYGQPQRMEKVESSTIDFLCECANSATTWLELIEQFTGRHQVRLMTVHKSKGLEAHTVVFLHLQDEAFNRNADMEEEKLTFFVAISRARERLFVTTTSPRRTRVKPLWDMLDAADVQLLP